jgi:hypothetical protein
MPAERLQINYKFNGTCSDFEREFAPAAAEIAKAPGLHRKSGWSTKPQLTKRSSANSPISDLQLRTMTNEAKGLGFIRK